jgi:hypothetical protein
MTDIEKRTALPRCRAGFAEDPSGTRSTVEAAGPVAFLQPSDRQLAYNPQDSVREADGTEDRDYALLSHSGLGSNSWALRTRIGNEKSMPPFIFPPIPLILELWRYVDLSFPIHISS